MAEDNVIPFPIRRPPKGTPEPPPDPADLTRQLLAAGHSPQDLITAITALASTRFEPSRPQSPTLLPRRDRAALFTLHVLLNGSQPKIWRRIVVSSDLPLDRLHHVLQGAMGWTDSHLHAFRVDAGGSTGRSRQAFLTQFDLEEGEEGTPETDVRLDETLGSVGDQLYYEYDFGDGWEHTIKLEAVDETRESEALEAQVTGGRRACPPEDVGGIHTYNELVAVLGGAGSDDDWMQEKLAWLPAGFDPTEFDREDADAAVAAAAAGRSTAYELPFVHPELIQLLLALGPFSPLDDLVAEASAAAAELSPEEMAAAVRPLSVLLDLVGPDGAELTAAGYLKPVVVERLARTTGITERWIGKANREDHTAPVAWLRSTAQATGLVRKSRQRLLLTRAGHRARQDPQHLWDRLVAVLPVGKRPEQRQAGLVALLVAAAGRPRYPFDDGAEALTSLGWRVDGLPITGAIAYESARPTWSILLALHPAEYRDMPPTAAAALARAALQPAVSV